MKIRDAANDYVGYITHERGVTKATLHGYRSNLTRVLSCFYAVTKPALQRLKCSCQGRSKVGSFALLVKPARLVL